MARPVRPKETLSVDTVHAVAECSVSRNSLATVRFLFILLAGFYGLFFRIDEINSFCLKDATINTDYMCIYVPKRKNDQYRVGRQGNLRAQLPELRELLRFCRSLIQSSYNPSNRFAYGRLA